MKAKSLIILAFLAMGLLSYVYFAIEKPAKEKESGTSKEDLLAPGNLSSLQSIKISTGINKIELEREKIGWRLLGPVKDLASQSKVESLIAALEKFKKTRVLFNPNQLVAENPDLAQYGLKPPKVTLEYKTSDLLNPVVLFLGEQNPSKNASYAHSEKEGVLLTTTDLDFLATQSPNDFREMRLTTVSSSDFEEVQVEYQGKKMKFKRDKDQWIMTQPYALSIDQDFTKNFMDKIGFVRANQFLNEIPQSLQQPEIRILVGFKKDVKDLRTIESDKRPEGFELQLSRVKKSPAKGQKEKTGEFDYFAKGDKTDAAFIAQFHYDNFTKPPEDFIKKTFNIFLNADVQKITVSKPQKADLVLTRSDKLFSMTAGKDNARADLEKVNKLLDQIRNMKATQFIGVTKTVKKPASLTVSLNLKDKKSLIFIFDFQKDSTVLWSHEGDSYLKYLTAKDVMTSKDFEMDALKLVEKASEPAKDRAEDNKKGSAKP